MIKFTGAAKLNDLKAKQKAYQALHQPRAPFKRLVQNQPIDCYEIDQEQDKIQIGKNNRLLEEDHSNENQNLTNNIQIQTVPTSNDNNQQIDNQISNYLIQFSQYININQNETNNSLLEEDHSKMISIKNKERTLKNLITTRKRVKKRTLIFNTPKLIYFYPKINFFYPKQNFTPKLIYFLPQRQFYPKIHSTENDIILT